MATRRMFSLQVVDTDRFLDMPATARLLYYDLGMRADDDGFLQNAQRIARTTGAGKDDLTWLVAKGFVLPFDSGVYVIRAWNVNNQLRRDRHRDTLCTAEKAQLCLTASGEYNFADGFTDQPVLLLPDGCQTVANPEAQHRLVKDSLDVSVADATPPKKFKRFYPPTVDEVSEYCRQRGNGVDAQKFVDFYESKGWMIGKSSMKDWKAAVRTWETRNSCAKGGNCYADAYPSL